MSAFCERIKPDPAEPDKALSTCDMITALASCPSFALIGEQCNAATIDAIEAALLENAQATLPPRSLLLRSRHAPATLLPRSCHAPATLLTTTTTTTCHACRLATLSP